MIRFTILGQPASKANSRSIVTIGDKPSSIKSKPAREYERDALAQIPPEHRRMLSCDVRVTLHLFYSSQRSDLDESIVLDVLQTRWKKDKQSGERYIVQRGVYCNDRQVREKHVYHHIDKENPRAEILIEPIEPMQETLSLAPQGETLKLTNPRPKPPPGRLIRECDAPPKPKPGSDPF